MEATASPNEVNRFGLDEGDVLITKDSEDWQDIAVPAVVDKTAEDFVCGYHLGLIRPGKFTDPEFIFRAMQSLSVNRQLQTSATGVTRYGVPHGAVGGTLIPLPPLSEQRAIAAFLDRETGKIDRLVGRKCLLIERLDEYRQALITRTVTRGLPPDAAHAAGLNPSPHLKPSGVEWLGEVPAHWEAKRLKRSVVRSDVKVESEDAGRMPYVGLENVTSWTGALPPDNQKTPESLSNAFTSGDVCFGKLRPYLAKAFCANFDGLCSTEFLILRSFGYQRQYLLYALLTSGFVSLVDSSTFGARMPRASWGFVGELVLPLPSLEEQRAIAAFLDRKIERVDALRSRVEVAIERLEEYRSALITAAVTGKIDVRGGATYRPRLSELARD